MKVVEIQKEREFIYLFFELDDNDFHEITYINENDEKIVERAKKLFSVKLERKQKLYTISLKIYLDGRIDFVKKMKIPPREHTIDENIESKNENKNELEDKLTKLDGNYIYSSNTEEKESSQERNGIDKIDFKIEADIMFSNIDIIKKAKSFVGGDNYDY